MAKKKEEKAKERKLSEKQMGKMETAHLEKSLRKTAIKEQDYKKKIVSLELDLAKVSAELKLTKLELEKRSLVEQDNTLNTDHKNFVDSIREEFSIEGNFGYNPDTGDII